MLLEQLPCSVLGQIFNNEDSSWCVLELWKCGSSALNARLAKSVTEIYLTDLDPQSTSRWPRCLKEFALVRLSVNRGHHGPLGTTLALQKELKKLSPTLKSLDIIGKGASRAFFFVPNQRTESHDDPTEAPPSKRSKLADANDDEPYIEPWNLYLTWPQLERLDIGGERDYTFEADRSVFHSSVFELLPRSLTYFNFQYKMVGRAYRDLSALPCGLKTLRLDHSQIECEGLRTLPKTLTNLGRCFGWRALDKLFKNDKILPNLGEFPSDLDAYSADNELLSYIHEGRSWPESIRDLIQTNVDNKMMFTKLPSKLVSLKSLGGDISSTLRPQYIAGLPRTLETLVLLRVQWTGIQLGDWPPNLTHLEALNIGISSFSLLPRSLKVLKFLSEADLWEHSAVIKRLNSSKTMEELKAIGREALQHDQERWLAAKAWLMTPQNVALGSEVYIQRVEDGELFGLPLGITTMTMPPSYPIPSSHTLLLPPYVASHAASIRIDDANALDLLPPTACMNLDVIIKRSESMDLDASPCESALYRSNLYALNMTFLNPRLKHSCLEYLPRALRKLELRGLNYIRTIELQNLPSKLEILDLDCRFATPLAPWIHLLPNTLRSLRVSAPIRGCDIIHLPPKLDRISAPFFSVTLAQARQLPRLLHSIVVDGCDERAIAEKHGVLHSLAWRTLASICNPFWRIREYSESLLNSELARAATFYPLDEDTPLDDELQTLAQHLSSLFLDIPLEDSQFPDITEELEYDDLEEEDEDEEDDDDESDYDLEDRCDGRGDVEAAQQQEQEDFDFISISRGPENTSVTLITEPSEDLDPRTARRFAAVSE